MILQQFPHLATKKARFLRNEFAKKPSSLDTLSDRRPADFRLRSPVLRHTVLRWPTLFVIACNSELIQNNRTAIMYCYMWGFQMGTLIFWKQHLWSPFICQRKRLQKKRREKTVLRPCVLSQDALFLFKKHLLMLAPEVWEFYFGRWQIGIPNLLIHLFFVNWNMNPLEKRFAFRFTVQKSPLIWS